MRAEIMRELYREYDEMTAEEYEEGLFQHEWEQAEREREERVKDETRKS